MRTISVRFGYVAAVLSIAGLFQVYNAPISAAAPNPDSCFTTTGTTSRTITGYNPAGAGCGLTVEIPSTIAGGTVVAIGDYPFYGDQITSLIIPNTVISIGNEAFGNNQLTSLIIPNSVTSLGVSVFRDNLLTSITIPNSLTTIPPATFSTNKLTTVSIPNSVTSIGSGAFGYNEITSVTLPNSITSIGSNAFNGNRITNLTLPNALTTLGSAAFAQNSIRSVVVPDTLTTIGDYTFYLQNLVGRDFLDIIGNGDPEDSQAAVNGIWYVQIYTNNPSNPNGLQDTLVYDTAELDGLDNDYNEFYVAGGYIVNPTTAELQFLDASTNKLLDPIVLTGQTPSGSRYFYDYISVNGPAIPTPVDPYSPTGAETAAIRNSLLQYYRAGSTLSYTAAIVNGVTPSPASYSFVLGANAASNKRQFVYATTSAVGELANTGLSLWVVIAAAGVVIVGSFGVLARR